MSASLDELVRTLAVQAPDDGGRPLLVKLRRSIWGDIGGTGASSRNIASVPIVVGSFDLWQDIAAYVTGMYNGASGKEAGPSTVVNLMAWLIEWRVAEAKGEITEAMTAVAAGRLGGWIHDIRELFDRSLSIPLRDFACPNCGQTRARWVEEKSKLEVEGNAIVVTLDDDLELVAVCRNAGCVDLAGDRSRWTGDTQVLYMARRAGIDVEALAEQIRLARMPVVEPTDPVDEGKVVLHPEDDGYHAQLAIIRGEVAS